MELLLKRFFDDDGEFMKILAWKSGRVHEIHLDLVSHSAYAHVCPLASKPFNDNKVLLCQIHGSQNPAALIVVLTICYLLSSNRASLNVENR